MGAVYATSQDLADRWRPLTTEEAARADVLLADAAVRIRAACSTVDERLAADPQELDPDIPKLVSVEMVRRAMLAPVDQAAMTQIQQTAGPFSQGGTFANPTGDLYLTKAEKQMLGCGGQQAFTVPAVSRSGIRHALICSINFGAGYCSCGADLTLAGPLYGVDQ